MNVKDSLGWTHFMNAYTNGHTWTLVSMDKKMPSKYFKTPRNIQGIFQSLCKAPGCWIKLMLRKKKSRIFKRLQRRLKKGLCVSCWSNSVRFYCLVILCKECLKMCEFPWCAPVPPQKRPAVRPRCETHTSSWWPEIMWKSWSLN